MGKQEETGRHGNQRTDRRPQTGKTFRVFETQSPGCLEETGDDQKEPFKKKARRPGPSPVIDYYTVSEENWQIGKSGQFLQERTRFFHQTRLAGYRST